MSGREVLLEDLNSLNAELMSKINELSLKVNETSTQLRFVTENSHMIHDHTEQVGKLFTKVAVLEKDVEFLKSNFGNCHEDTCKQFETTFSELKKEVTDINKISEQCQELQGQINQIRLFVEKNENERKEKRASFIRNLLYPIITGAVLLYFGYMFNRIVKNSSQSIPPHHVEHRVINENGSQ